MKGRQTERGASETSRTDTNKFTPHNVLSLMTDSSNRFLQQELKIAGGLARHNGSSADHGNEATFTWKRGTTEPILKVKPSLSSDEWPEDYCFDFDITFPPKNNGNKYGYVGAVALLGQVYIVVTHGIKLFPQPNSGTGFGLMVIEQSNGNGPYFATEELGGPKAALSMTFCYKESPKRPETPVWYKNGKPVKAGYLYNPEARYPTDRDVPLTFLSGSHTSKNVEPLVGGKLDSFSIRPYYNPIKCREAVMGEPKRRVFTCSEKGTVSEGTLGTMCLKTNYKTSEVNDYRTFGYTQGCDLGTCSCIENRNSCCTYPKGIDKGKQVICADSTRSLTEEDFKEENFKEDFKDCSTPCTMNEENKGKNGCPF